MPSNWAPIRSIARRERSLRASVCRHTDSTSQTSKAWPSMSRFISVFAAVRIAERASHVYPISQTSGAGNLCLGWPGGHGHHTRSQNLVEPITAPSAIRMTANGAAVPASRWASAASMYSAAAASPCGTALSW